MKVVMVEPGQYARAAEIGNELESMQAAVGGLIDCAYPWREKVCIVCSDEGLIKGMPVNRAVERYGKLRDVAYALYEQKAIPLEMLIKAERRLGRLEMDVRLAEHGLTALPQPAPEQPKQETVRAVADWLKAAEKDSGETGMAQVREYILDFWKCAGE